MKPDYLYVLAAVRGLEPAQGLAGGAGDPTCDARPPREAVLDVDRDGDGLEVCVAELPEAGREQSALESSCIGQSTVSNNGY